MVLSIFCYASHWMDFLNIQLINTVTLGTPMGLDNIVIVVDSDMKFATQISPLFNLY